jgi:hypothetical protein
MGVAERCVAPVAERCGALVGAPVGACLGAPVGAARPGRAIGGQDVFGDQAGQEGDFGDVYGDGRVAAGRRGDCSFDGEHLLSLDVSLSPAPSVLTHKLQLTLRNPWYDNRTGSTRVTAPVGQVLDHTVGRLKVHRTAPV